MKTLILPAKDIQQIAQRVGMDELMDEMIRRLEVAFAAFDHGQFRTPARDGLQYTQPHYGLLEWMPTMENGKLITIKNVGYHPDNPTHHDTSTILSTIQSYDPITGHLVGIMDATFLTALRTGAASAVMSELLARKNSRCIGLIGTGAQAVTQLHALSRRFDIEQVLLFDRETTHAQSFADRSAFIDAPKQLADRATILAQSDILCTCTSEEPGRGPVLEDGEHQPWLHINAIGSDFIGKTELPLALLRRSTTCPDFLAQANKEGECQQLEDSEIGPGMIELIKHRERYAELKEDLTVFDSTGWSLEDHIGLQMLGDYAREFGLGSEIQIELDAPDPLDPYSFLQPAELPHPQ